VSALNVAHAKARGAVVDADDVVVAADTLVVVDGGVLGKPVDAEDAMRMLRDLRGRGHEVLTGVAVRTAQEREWGAVVGTRVVMRAYGDDEVAAYVARGEPFDKAGAYAVQDTVFEPVERLEGCYLNVVGLPLCAVAAGLVALGIEVAAVTERPPCALCRAGAPLVAIGGTQRAS
jgi:septum formation protein